MKGFAEIEQRIIDRLRACSQDLARWPGAELRFGSTAEVEDVETLRQMAPAVWIIYDGVVPGPTNGQKMFGVQEVDMEFILVACAKSARGNGKNIAARDEASEIEGFIVESLLGFDVGGGKRLRLNDSAGPSYDAGYCHVPLTFTCSVTLRGKP